MGENSATFLKWMFVISVIALVLPILGWAFSLLFRPNSRRSTVSTTLKYSFFLLVSIFCQRYSVEYFWKLTGDENAKPLSHVEQIFHSISTALKTFGVDENCEKYIFAGKKMVEQVLGFGEGGQTAYGILSAFLTVLAPILGGAVVFEILASVFPQIKLRFANLLIWKEKYLFSELNEASLALVKSITSKKRNVFTRPILIFCDAYLNNDDEKSNEMLIEAKKLGAICLRDDISHVKKCRFGRKSFFLVGANQGENLQAYMTLTHKQNLRYLKNSEIFLFTENDTYEPIEKRTIEKLKAMGIKEKAYPVLKPINGYRNLVRNMLTKIPLYEPLVDVEDNPEGKDLTVTIVGSGCIGIEMFLSAYWCGQILNHNLKIRVVSQESEQDFWNKIDYINPEIKLSTIRDHEILRVNETEFSQPYCSVEYVSCDVTTSEFVAHLGEGKGSILDTDYYFVSLGNDEDNILTAELIKRHIGIHKTKVGVCKKAVITYVVYASELAETLNQKRRHSFTDKTVVDVYMSAVGSLKDVYSVESVFLEEHDEFAELSFENYCNLQNSKTKEPISEREERAKNAKKSEYEYWADRSRSMHQRYRAYATGFVDTSVFTNNYGDLSQEGAEQRLDEEYCKKLKENCKSFTSAVNKTSNKLENPQKIIGKATTDEVAWMEHRRWCAFTRVKGFESTTSIETYRGYTGNHKHMELKLHPCLVECDKNGMKPDVHDETVTSQLDMLDLLTRRVKEKGDDFKKYDYPIETIKL